MSSLSVIVADDHPVYREGLMRSLETHPGIELRGGAGDGESAIDLIVEVEPDVAVLDLKLPGIDGVGVLERLSELELMTKVLILTAYVDSHTVFRAFSHGARGYMEKVASTGEIAKAILAIGAGRTLMTPGAQDMIADELRNRQNLASVPTLTSREIEILRLAAEGNSSQQIAVQLHISLATVKTHLQHTYEKLGVSDRASAVAQAIRSGVLS